MRGLKCKVRSHIGEKTDITQPSPNGGSAETAVSKPAPILVGRVGDILWISVEGKGSFQNSPLAKQCIQTMIEGGARQFVVDLERCPIMDSTFLGMLAGAALKLRELGDGKATVINANTRNQHLLRNLGLDHILHLDHAGSCYQAERKEVGRELSICRETAQVGTKADRIGHVLEAHKALVQANAQNVSRFKDVIEFLEKETRKSPPAEG